MSPTREHLVEHPSTRGFADSRSFQGRNCWSRVLAGAARCLFARMPGGGHVIIRRSHTNLVRRLPPSRSHPSDVSGCFYAYFYGGSWDPVSRSFYACFQRGSWDPVSRSFYACFQRGSWDPVSRSFYAY